MYSFLKLVYLVSICTIYNQYYYNVNNCYTVIFIKGIGVDLLQLKKEIADTQLIDQHKNFEVTGFCGDRLYLSGLSKLLMKYGIIYREADFHNAACDAYYTMKVFLCQMGHGNAIINSL